MSTKPAAGRNADVNPIDALVPCDHLKGNRSSRISWETREIRTTAWEEVSRSTKQDSIAAVHRMVSDLIRVENAKRRENGFKTDLIVPSFATVRAHRPAILSDTEYLVATEGSTVARNRRGCGSTDVRAPFIGEYVEIDENRLSLVSCAKARKVRAKLTVQQRRVLEEINGEIRARLTLIIVIDIATRIPLAWVLSDQPGTEATLEALRMATRDMTREKVISGCTLKPMKAMAIGHIKNDNGTGLRNARVKAALLGTGATNTDARAHAATDKSYVERVIGTTESVFVKLIEGYTRFAVCRCLRWAS